MSLRTQRALIPISYERGQNNPNAIMLRRHKPYYIYDYYLWFWVEYSEAKKKRRKANKVARKQRKVNRHRL